MRTIAISDIHGQFRAFKQLLKQLEFDLDKDQLILLGDYVDRGKQSLEVLEFVSFLKDKGAIVLGGNHENLLLDWLDHPNDKRIAANYFQNGGGETIRSLSEEAAEDDYPTLQMRIQATCPDLIAMIRGLPNFYETADTIYVHAGIDPDKADFRMTSEDDFRWIRHSFWVWDNTTGKQILFGHTPTGVLRQQFGEESNDFSPYTLPGGTKTAIDGGAAFGKQLNALVMENGRTWYDFVSVED